jgi:hypothetical protein
VARVTQVEARLGQTVNLGHYNSLRLEFAVTLDLEPGDDQAAVAEQAWRICEGELAAKKTEYGLAPRHTPGAEDVLKPARSGPDGND